MSDSLVAIARFARSAGGALMTLAVDLEAIAESPDLNSDEEVELPTGRGQRQQQILELPALTREEGVKTADIANEIEYEVPNTHSTLQALERAGLVEMIASSSPQRWRLAPRYRTTSVVFKRMASRLRSGEWTTYGDVSIAVRGDTRAARGVGRASATVRDFPNASQILMEGGVINPNWHDDNGRGADHCRRKLEEQGISFADNGHADPARRVAWDELRRRDEAEPVAE